MNRFFRLLAFGYFPKEVPPVFWTGDFAKSVGRAQPQLASILSKKWSKPCAYLLQQRARYRRPLSIPNPNAFVSTAHTITTHYAAIQAKLAKSNFAVSSPKFNRKTKFFRAVGPNHSGDELRVRKLGLRASFPYIVRFDIKNFYRSVYTHSIEWAVVGKATAKASLSKGAPGNPGKDLDTAVRMGQDGQTIGIPVGPDTSFLIAETILAAIDDRLGFDRKCALRFYDDYEVGAASEGEAEEILHQAESAFAEYELELNPDKSHVLKSSGDLNSSWRLQIKAATKERPRRPEDAVDLFSLASSLARQNHEDFVLGYFLRRMRMFVLPKPLWGVWQQILMATAIAEYGALRGIYEQLDLYERIGYRVNKTQLRDVLLQKAKRELRGSVSSELSWILFGFLKFGLVVDAQLIADVLTRGDDVSRILALKLAAAKKLSIKAKVRQLLAQLGPVGPHSEHWLLFWEMYRNGWAPSAALQSALTVEPIFAHLDKEGVSFLRDPGVDLLEIPAPFQDAIDKLHGAGEVSRIEEEIKKTFADTSQELPGAKEEAEEEDEAEEEVEY